MGIAHKGCAETISANVLMEAARGRGFSSGSKPADYAKFRTHQNTRHKENFCSQDIFVTARISGSFREKNDEMSQKRNVSTNFSRFSAHIHMGSLYDEN